MPRLTPNLWFDTEALEAAEFYVSVFPNSRVTGLTHYGEAGPGPAGTVLTVEFELDGQPFLGINGGPAFTFDEAVALLVHCTDQAEIDHYWSRLSEVGEESQCGWLKDRYGLSWQVCPTGMKELFNDPDPGRRDRAMRAMLGMGKIDLAALRAAADGADPEAVPPGPRPLRPRTRVRPRTHTMPATLGRHGHPSVVAGPHARVRLYVRPHLAAERMGGHPR